MASTRARRLLGVAALVVAVVLAVAPGLILALVLYTEAGTRMAGEAALQWYDDSIPGSSTVGAISGRLGDRFSLRDLLLRDAAGEPLIEVEELIVEWSPFSLMYGRLVVERISIRGAEILLDRDLSGVGFLDLAMKGTGEEDETEWSGPDLPIPLEAELSLEDVVIRRSEIDGPPQVVAYLAKLDLSLVAARTRARVRVPVLSGSSPDLGAVELGFSAAWSDPVAGVSDLRAITDYGSVTVPVAAFNFEDEVGHAEAFVSGYAGAIGELSGLSISEDIEVSVSVAGGVQALNANLALMAGPTAAIEILGEGSIGGVFDMKATMLAWPVDRGEHRWAGGDVTVGEGHVHVSGSGLADISVTGQISCRECWASPLGRFDLDFDSSMVKGEGSASAEISVAGIRAVLGGRFKGGKVERACAAVSVEDISFTAAALSRLMEIPSVGGALVLDLECERSAGKLACRGDATGRGLRLAGNSARVMHLDLSADPLEPGRPFDVRLNARGLRVGGQRVSRFEARLQGDTEKFAVSLRGATPDGDWLRGRAGIVLEDGVAVDLEKLRGDFHGASVRLAHRADFAYRKGILSIAGLDLRVASGNVAVNGEIDRNGASDLTARVAGVKLERLPKELVGNGASGRVSLLARIIGEPDAPRVQLSGSVEGLGWGGEPLGDLRFEAGHDGSRLVVDGSLVRDGIRSADLHAALPLRLSLREPGVGIGEDAPLEVRLDLTGLDISQLASFAPDQMIRGVLDAKIVVEGTPRSPRGTISASGRGLARRDLDLGDASLFAAFSHDYLYVDLENRGGVARELNLTMKAELERSPLESRSIALARGGINDVKLEARDLRLGDLTDSVPGVTADGLIDVEVWMNGSPGDPDGWLSITSSRVEVEGVEAGPLEISAQYEDGSVVVNARVQGGPAREVEVSATLPVGITLDAVPEWKRGRPHEIDLRAQGLDLEAARRIAASHGIDVEDLDMTGVVDVVASLNGTPVDPRVEVTARSDDLEWDGHRIGALDLWGKMDGGQARIETGIVQGEGRWARLEATAPYFFELDPFLIGWDEGGPHSIRLEAKGIDRAVLAPIWEAPEGSDLRLDIDLDGGGNTKEFALRGKLKGNILAEGIPTLPFRGSLEADFRDQRVELDFGPEGALLASIDARSEIPIDDLLRGEGHPAGGLVDAHLRIPGVQLAYFSAFLPSNFYGMEGLLTGKIDIGGTIEAPNPVGYLDLTDGEITIVDLGQRLRGIGLRAQLDGRRASVTDLRFSSGSGRGKGGGEISIEEDGTVRGSLRAVIEQFPLIKPGLPDLTVDSEATLIFVRQRRSTEVFLTLRKSRVRILTMQSSRVPREILTTSDFHIGDIATGGVVSESPGRQAPAAAEPHRTRFVLDVTDPIEISGSDVDMRWGGRVEAISISGSNEVSGRIEAEGGRFWLLNNTFVIESGEVGLAPVGKLDPYIRLVARTETREALITVTIVGRLSRPELTLASDPAMSQYQILTMLLTGRSDTGEGGENSSEVKAQTASLLMAFNNPALERQLNDRLGVDRIGLSMGEGMDEPILAVGKRLGRHFYVETEYHHNAPSTENRTGGRVEYYIDSRWSIETFYGDANKGGIDLFWRKRFGKDKKKRFVIPVVKKDSVVNTPGVDR